MIRFAAGRLVYGLVAVWLAATVTFLLVHLSPGGPALALAGDYGAPGYVEDLTHAYGLDRPLPVIYIDWLSHVAKGDLGVSYRSKMPVGELIAEQAPVTIALMLPALVLASLAGVALGMASAGARRGRAVVGLLASLHAVPSYVIAHILVLALAVGLGALPVQGLVDPRAASLAGLAGLIDKIRHLILPVLSLALVQLAFIALVSRARIGEEAVRPYATTALAKGLSRRRVLLVHALPNAALPILTLIGWRFGAMIGGSVVVETVFALPGLGRLAVASAIARDHPTVIGIVLVASAAVIAANMTVDMLVRWFDPRIGSRHP